MPRRIAAACAQDNPSLASSHSLESDSLPVGIHGTEQGDVVVEVGPGVEHTGGQGKVGQRVAQDGRAACGTGRQGRPGRPGQG